MRDLSFCVTKSKMANTNKDNCNGMPQKIKGSSTLTRWTFKAEIKEHQGSEFVVTLRQLLN